MFYKDRVCLSKNKLIYYLYLIICFLSNCIIISKTEAEENNYESYIIQKYDTIVRNSVETDRSFRMNPTV
jgi:hypothetical protein